MTPKGPPPDLFRRIKWLLLALACTGCLDCKMAVAANPQAEQLIERGDAEVKALHAPEALALFDQAAQADPEDVEILLRVSQQCSDLIAHHALDTGKAREVLVAMLGDQPLPLKPGPHPAELAPNP